MQLAPELTQALNALLEGVSRNDLAREAQKMSAGYRAGTGSQAIATPLQAKAYAVARMPATYAACAAVFERLKQVMARPILVDLRNVYPPQEPVRFGFSYHSVGRPSFPE